jgi:hypothetical protein
VNHPQYLPRSDTNKVAAAILMSSGLDGKLLEKAALVLLLLLRAASGRICIMQHTLGAATLLEA